MPENVTGFQRPENIKIALILLAQTAPITPILPTKKREEPFKLVSIVHGDA